MSHDQEYDLEGWFADVNEWLIGDVTMDGDGQVTKLSWSKQDHAPMEVICWAPTSGMLRRRGGIDAQG